MMNCEWIEDEGKGWMTSNNPMVHLENISYEIRLAKNTTSFYCIYTFEESCEN